MTGFKIGAAEVFTKMLLYYLHERTWYKIDFGLPNRRSKEEKKTPIDQEVSILNKKKAVDQSSAFQK